MTKSPHLPVLLEQVLESFTAIDPGYIVDCTIGYAGHSSALLKDIPDISIVGIDRDIEALEFSTNRLSSYESRTKFYKGTFAKTINTIKERPIVGILADFGVSSLQLDKMERGFSFESENLDMRMDRDSSLRAYNIVNEYTYEKLLYIFKHYGEISQASKLANEIIRVRNHSPIGSGKELSLIAKKVLYASGKIHPATLMFQAIRIEVNNELGEIEGLLDAIEALKPSNTIVSLITFHSLEDRLVKNRFKQWAQNCICDPSAMRCTCGKNNSLGKVITKKPLTANKAELKQNPRSRSAKLRIFKFRQRTDEK